MSRNRSQKLQSESFFLFPLPPTVQCDVVHQHLDLPHKQHTNSCKQHVLNLHVLLSARGILRIHSASGNFCFQRFFIFTRFTNWSDVTTKWCYISIQCFRWTYERTALPYSFPDCFVGLCGFQFSAQVEIENVVFENDWNEFFSSKPAHQSLKMSSHSLTNFAVNRNHVAPRQVPGRNLVVLCTRPLQRCTTLCVHQCGFHPEI